MYVLQTLYVALLVASFTVQLILTKLEQDGVRSNLQEKVCNVRFLIALFALAPESIMHTLPLAAHRVSDAAGQEPWQHPSSG